MGRNEGNNGTQGRTKRATIQCPRDCPIRLNRSRPRPAPHRGWWIRIVATVSAGPAQMSDRTSRVISSRRIRCTRLARLVMGLCLAPVAVGCGRSEPPRVADPDAAVDAPVDDRPERGEKPDDSDGGGEGNVAGVALQPKSTFKQHCANCHGEQGAFYAIPFKYEGDALREVIADMMRNYAGLEPTEADVDAMLEYHLQIRDRRMNGND